MSGKPFDNSLSIYIPRVHNCSHVKDSKGIVYENLNTYINSIFHTLGIGLVSCVELVPIPGSGGKTTNFSKAFVHFIKWYPDSHELQEKIYVSEIDGANTPVRLMYASPHYWILKPNKSRAGELKKIDSLETRVVELSECVSRCNELLAAATQQLANMKCADDDSVGSSYKRRRNV